ncbi:Flp pilus assembly protein CpaB [Shimia haliotis]|uniref:Pilus assembly protein CpaB n=1 Tax=Shimia haliotis TaxID=1280847 RepID=A0A1I4FAP4_9RHOB|nr:Flp pilus assembly protein CpaB [Shimia haliotis]SFL13876.1 pilus assembly protein CpaB [Shimia haliotis]
MRAIFAAVLLVGLGIAGFAVYMAQNYIQGYESALARQKNETPSIELVEGFIVSRPMKYGETLEPKDLLRVKWPKKAMPEGMFLKAEEIFPPNDDRRRVMLRSMEKGELLIAAKVTQPGQHAGITSRLSSGQRAFTIKVDATSGVSGFLRPGDRVDVLWTGNPSGDRDRGEITKLIDANVSIVAIDQSTNEEEEAGRVARTVTVSGTLQQVAALELAQQTGRLSLTLVGATDDTVSTAVEIDQRQLLGIVEEEIVEEVAEIEQERVCTITNNKGTEKIKIVIPCTN